MIYFSVDDKYAPFGVPLGSLWPSFGVPLAVLGHLWGPFGAPWAALGRILDFVEKWTPFSEQMCQIHDTVVQNQASRNSPADLLGSAGNGVKLGWSGPGFIAPGARIT